MYKTEKSLDVYIYKVLVYIKQVNEMEQNYMYNEHDEREQISYAKDIHNTTNKMKIMPNSFLLYLLASWKWLKAKYRSLLLIWWIFMFPQLAF